MLYKIIGPTLTLLLIAIACTQCTKSELTSYLGSERVYIYKDPFSTTNDSITYSFATKPSTLIVDTVKIPIRIMGAAKNTDRTVGVKVIVDSSTAEEGTDFNLAPAKIMANQYSGFIPVLVKRNGSQKNQEKRLRIEIIGSSDFQTGLPNTTPQNPRAGGSLKYLVKINDFLSKPANWDTQLISYYGAYSQTKYALVIKTTGRSEFLFSGTTDPVTFSQMLYFKIICKDSLSAYESANGPLIDENGIRVTFPN